MSSYSDLQAVYLYNFAKYIKWPSDGSDTFVIGIYGGSEMVNRSQEILKGKKVFGKGLVVKALTNDDSEILTCHIVYFSKSASKKISPAMQLLANRSTLIVAEEDGMIRKGAMISFFMDGDRLRFKLRKTSLTDANLIPSEGLLNLAAVY